MQIVIVKIKTLKNESIKEKKELILLIKKLKVGKIYYLTLKKW